MRMTTMFFVAAAMLVPSTVILAATSCTSIRCQCRQERQASIEACREACAGYSDVLAAQQDCQSNAGARRSDCVTKKCKPIPADPSAHCQPTFDCVEQCDATRQNQIASCNQVFARSWKPLRKQCATFKDCKQNAKDAFKTCLDNGGPAAAATAPGVAAATLATTAAAPACINPNPDECANEASTCVGNLLSSCYALCRKKCHYNPTAISICERGCRDGHCGSLVPCKAKYNNCCGNGPDGDQIPLPDGTNCTPTTTSTSVATSTSTVSVTTTSTSTTTSTTTP